MRPAGRPAAEKPSEWNGGIGFHHKHTKRKGWGLRGEQHMVPSE